VRRDREIVRSVGGITVTKRRARDTAVGGPATKVGGSAEGMPTSPKSETDSGEVAGASGRPGASQSHRAGRASPPSLRSGFGVSSRGSSGSLGASQQQPAVAAARFAAQQGRLQQGFGAGVDESESVTGDSCGAVGVRADGVQTQARAGTAAPIAVETASSRQRSSRTLRAMNMVKSYTRGNAPVNGDYHRDGSL
jgi:hypothetical protein